jgi:hypothetical protein
MQPNQFPVIGAHQAHPICIRDRVAARIAGLSEAGRLPKLNRAITRKGATFNPASNALSNDVCDHVSQDRLSVYPINRRFVKGHPLMVIGASDDSPSASR